MVTGVDETVSMLCYGVRTVAKPSKSCPRHLQPQDLAVPLGVLAEIYGVGIFIILCPQFLCWAQLSNLLSVRNVDAQKIAFCTCIILEDLFTTCRNIRSLFASLACGSGLSHDLNLAITIAFEGKRSWSFREIFLWRVCEGGLGLH